MEITVALSAPCPLQSYAVSVTAKTGWKLVYSGKCLYKSVCRGWNVIYIVTCLSVTLYVFMCVFQFIYFHIFRELVFVTWLIAGDTRPCQKLVELGRGATILIHEVGR